MKHFLLIILSLILVAGIALAQEEATSTDITDELSLDDGGAREYVPPSFQGGKP